MNLIDLFRFSRKLILITSMLGMCLSYAVLGICFYIIETNMSAQSQEELTPSYVFPHGWVPPLSIITLLFLGIFLIIFLSKLSP